MERERPPTQEPPSWRRGDWVRLPDGRTGTILTTNQRVVAVDPDEGGPVVYVDAAEALTRLAPEADEKEWLYWGRRRDDGITEVMVVDPQTGTGRPLPLRSPFSGGRLHSPTGFEWGYEGSGPAQLAFNLLQHATHPDPHPALYQAFKRERIAPLQRDRPWEIAASNVRAWVRRRRESSAEEDGSSF